MKRIVYGDFRVINDNIRGMSENKKCYLQLLIVPERYDEFLLFTQNAETIRSYVVNHTDSLTFHELKCKDDANLYTNTTGDGLCSLRAAKIACAYHGLPTTQLPSDVNLSNNAERKAYQR